MKERFEEIRGPRPVDTEREPGAPLYDFLGRMWDHDLAMFMAGVEASAQYVERAAKWYSTAIFKPIPEEAKAKDGVAADLLRDMYPRLAAALRSEIVTSLNCC